MIWIGICNVNVICRVLCCVWITPIPDLKNNCRFGTPPALCIFFAVIPSRHKMELCDEWIVENAKKMAMLQAAIQPAGQPADNGMKVSSAAYRDRECGSVRCGNAIGARALSHTQARTQRLKSVIDFFGVTPIVPSSSACESCRRTWRIRALCFAYYSNEILLSSVHGVGTLCLHTKFIRIHRPSRMPTTIDEELFSSRHRWNEEIRPNVTPNRCNSSWRARASVCCWLAGWLAGWGTHYTRVRIFILIFFSTVSTGFAYIRSIYGVNDDGNECNVSIKSERQTTTL